MTDNICICNSNVKESHVYEWIIHFEKIKRGCCQEEVPLLSPQFSFDDSCITSECHLEISPAPERVIALILKPLVLQSSKLIRASFSIEIWLSSLGKMCNTEVEQFVVFQCNNVKIVKFESVINHAVEIYPSITNAHRCKLNIKCKAKVYEDTSSTTFTLKSAKGLSDEMSNLLNNQNFSDTTIVAREKKFPVHKNILAARSPVFDAMFQHNLMETEQKVVTITDIDPEVVSEMITYMYTGKTDKLGEMAAELLVAAEKYEISGLKSDCEAYLKHEINVQNAVDLLILSDLHSAKSLKYAVLLYIILNAKDVMITVENSALSNYSDLKDIFTAFAEK